MDFCSTPYFVFVVCVRCMYLVSADLSGLYRRDFEVLPALTLSLSVTEGKNLLQVRVLPISCLQLLSSLPQTHGDLCDSPSTYSPLTGAPTWVC